MSTSAASVPDTHVAELRERIPWLIRLRWLAACGVAVTVGLVPRVLGVPLAQRPLFLLAAALGLYNLALWALSRALSSRAPGPWLHGFANLQISVDLAFLASLVHFSGGIENPFVCYFVFHIVIASILLSRRATYVQTGLAVGLVSGVAALEGSGLVGHYHLPGVVGGEQYRSPRYVIAILFVMATTLAFTAWMATSITTALRDRQAKVLELSASLKKRRDELEEAYHALRQLEKARAEYLHRVAHHLRSPVAAVESLLAVVADGRAGDISERSRELLLRARARLRGLLDLAHDLLALSRAREAPLTKVTATVDLREVLSAVVRDLEPQAAAAGVALEASCGPDVPTIRGDPEGLAELLANLLSNAIKYSNPGQRVQASISKQQGQIEIVVRDSGIGIPPREQGQVFEEFYRATNARKSGKEGTGLGLSIVRSVAEAHGGVVALESALDQGTTVRVTLPLTADSQPSAPTFSLPVGAAVGNKTGLVHGGDKDGRAR